MSHEEGTRRCRYSPLVCCMARVRLLRNLEGSIGSEVPEGEWRNGYAWSCPCLGRCERRQFGATLPGSQTSDRMSYHPMVPVGISPESV